LYAGQIERLFKLFPRAQIHFFRTDALWTKEAATIAAVQEFLGVEQASLGGASRYVVAVDASALGQMPSCHHRQTEKLFGDDIRRTAALTGLDLSDWLDQSYTEPMAPPSTN